MKRIYAKETFSKQLYWVWAAMIQRCHNPGNKAYEDYGGRGITVCDRWHEYKNFAADVGPRPTGMSIDRADNNKGYGPDNFRWADSFVQAGNRRYCIMVPDGAESVPLKVYCRRHGLEYRAITKRLRRGWTLEHALSIPVGINRKDTATLPGTKLRGNPTKFLPEDIETIRKWDAEPRESRIYAIDLCKILGVDKSTFYRAIRKMKDQRIPA